MRSDTLRALKQCARHHSIELLRTHGSNSSIELTEYSAVSHQPERMVYIIISEWALKIAFRVHYDFSAVATLAGLDTSDIEKARAISTDFVKEFCNLLAGALMRDLECNDRPLGMSLPIPNKSIEPVKPKSDQPPKFFHDLWRLGINQNAIYCGMTVEVSDPATVDGLIVPLNPTAAGGSEIEFL